MVVWLAMSCVAPGTGVEGMYCFSFGMFLLDVLSVGQF